MRNKTEWRPERGAEEISHYWVNMTQTPDMCAPGFAPGQSVHMVFAQVAGAYYAIPAHEIAKDAEQLPGSYVKIARDRFAEATSTTPDQVTLLAALAGPRGGSPDIPQGATYTMLAYDE
jgi:hypothetical protein